MKTSCPWILQARTHWSGLPFPTPEFKKKKKIKPTLNVKVAQLYLTLYDPMGFSRQKYWSV